MPCAFVQTQGVKNQDTLSKVGDEWAIAQLPKIKAISESFGFDKNIADLVVLPVYSQRMRATVEAGRKRGKGDGEQNGQAGEAMVGLKGPRCDGYEKMSAEAKPLDQNVAAFQQPVWQKLLQIEALLQQQPKASIVKLEDDADSKTMGRPRRQWEKEEKEWKKKEKLLEAEVEQMAKELKTVKSQLAKAEKEAAKHEAAAKVAKDMFTKLDAKAVLAKMDDKITDLASYFDTMGSHLEDVNHLKEWMDAKTLDRYDSPTTSTASHDSQAPGPMHVGTRSGGASTASGKGAHGHGRGRAGKVRIGTLHGGARQN